ncbi:hypothetical protein [Bacillus sp. Bos-x628]
MYKKHLSLFYFYPDQKAVDKGEDGIDGEKTANAVARFQRISKETRYTAKRRSENYLNC